MAKKVLIVCTSADQFAGKPSGCWVEEVAAPYWVFKENGYDVTIASIKGGEVPFDEASLNPPFLTKEAEKFVEDDFAFNLVIESVKLGDVTNLGDYDAIFLPGGHGTVVDFPDNAELAKTLQQFWDSGKVVSAVCHGPVGFASAVSSSGEPIVKGKRVTGFTNTEESAVGKDEDVPFLLEDKLKELGGFYEKKDNWTPHAIRDGKLVTGQNPASSHDVALLVVEALSE